MTKLKVIGLTVKSMTTHKGTDPTGKNIFRYVQVKVIKESLLLAKEIPVNCIEFIVSVLKRERGSPEINGACNALCLVNMSDHSPCKANIYRNLKNIVFPLDNIGTFKKYGGVEALIELFKAHKSFNVAKALIHVMKNERNQSVTLFTSYYYYYYFLKL